MTGLNRRPSVCKTDALTRVLDEREIGLIQHPGRFQQTETGGRLSQTAYSRMPQNRTGPVYSPLANCSRCQL